MKFLFSLFILAGLTLTAQADHPGHGKKKKSAVVVFGKRAKAIYTSLEAEKKTITIKDKKFDVKEVGGLRCSECLSETKHKRSKFRCVLRGKKLKKKRGHRHARRDHPRRSRPVQNKPL